MRLVVWGSDPVPKVLLGEDQKAQDKYLILLPLNSVVGVNVTRVSPC